MQDKLTINCPKCGEAISLDETLAGPMIAQIRAESERLVHAARIEAEAKVKALGDQRAAIEAKSKALDEREASIMSTVNQAMAAERILIAQAERESIRKEIAPELEAEKRRATELASQLETSQKAELALRQQRDDLELRTKSLDLEVARRVDAQRQTIQEQAAVEAEEKSRLRLAEKDKTISDMHSKLEEVQRKATQGSQQMQGEVFELDFMSNLRMLFPQDTIESVKTGALGGDVLQRVMGEMGRVSGTLFWEMKRTQTWGGDWTSKAKKDSSAAKADATIIVSEVLPKDVKDFGLYEGVWVTKQSFAYSLGLALRQGVISTFEARQMAVGKETKMERIYAYMTGPEFRSTLIGIAEPFRELYEELQSEKRTTQARWKRQEKRIERVLSNVAGLQGDLQGIAGSEISALPTFLGEPEEPGEE